MAIMTYFEPTYSRKKLTIFDECGYTYIWDTHTIANLAWLILNMKQNLQDQFIHSWFSNIEHSGKALKKKAFQKTI
jgi:hypothetical protein